MFKILFEDDWFLAAEKPAGLPSQATVDKSRPDFFTQLKKQLQNERGADFYLALHHRLDRDTSGVMIFAKNKEANDPLANMFKKHLIQKTYVALTRNRKMPETWEFKNHLMETKDHKLKKTKMKSTASGGDMAHTKFRLIEKFKLGMMVEAQPLTGRMHQIRVHLAEEHMGIFGDDIYPCGKTPVAPRLMLHALSLEFHHPFTQQDIKIESTLPEDMKEFILALQST